MSQKYSAAGSRPPRFQANTPYRCWPTIPETPTPELLEQLITADTHKSHATLGEKVGIAVTAFAFAAGMTLIGNVVQITETTAQPSVLNEL